MAYNFSLTDADLNQVQEQAEAFKIHYKESGGFQSGIPICFLSEGTYVFRIYPDRDSKGFARIIKSAWIHNKIPLGGERFIRCWQDSRIDKLFDEAKECGMEKIFGKFVYQYKSREQGYMMAHYFESTDTEYTKAGETYGTVLDKRTIFAIQDFMASLSPEDKRQMIDPNNKAPGIKLSITRAGNKSNVNCGIASISQKLELPPIEFKDENGKDVEYNGLDQVYITEDQKISEEELFLLKKMVYEEIANFKVSGGSAVDKSAEGHKFSDRAKTASLTKEELIAQHRTAATIPAIVTSTGATGDDLKCRLAEQAKTSTKIKEAYPDAQFGNKPDRPTPYCMACDLETECVAATAKNKSKAA